LFAPLPGSSDRYPGLKLEVLVRPGTVATLLVPQSERDHFPLLYRPARWNDRDEYRFADGESAVTLAACKKTKTRGTDRWLDPMTQFNGALLVLGVRCAPLDVFVRGKPRPIRVILSFGAGHCA
jgi:hypothetical protein